MAWQAIIDTGGTTHIVDEGGVRQLTRTAPDWWELAFSAGNWAAIVRFARGVLEIDAGVPVSPEHEDDTT